MKTGGAVNCDYDSPWNGEFNGSAQRVIEAAGGTLSRANNIITYLTYTSLRYLTVQPARHQPIRASVLVLLFPPLTSA